MNDPEGGLTEVTTDHSRPQPTVICSPYQTGAGFV